MAHIHKQYVYSMLLQLATILSGCLAQSAVGSWLQCPPSFNTEMSPSQVGPCDGGRLDQDPPPITDIQAGERLKVAWPSLNQGGGIVRLALVPEKDSFMHSAYDASVIKLTCFGHDQRVGRYNQTTGLCLHPCNGRPGCHFQQSTDDLERYDTSIAIPTNLEDGIYVLQWKALIGDEPLPYYSCSKLRIAGGHAVGQQCAPPPLNPPNCMVTDNGPKMNALMKGSSCGEFCFLSTPGSGSSIVSNNVDGSIGWRQPVNFDCDPRLDCSVSLLPAQCEHELVPVNCTVAVSKAMGPVVAELPIDFSLEAYGNRADDIRQPFTARSRPAQSRYRYQSSTSNSEAPTSSDGAFAHRFRHSRQQQFGRDLGNRFRRRRAFDSSSEQTSDAPFRGSGRFRPSARRRALSGFTSSERTVAPGRRYRDRRSGHHHYETPHRYHARRQRRSTVRRRPHLTTEEDESLADNSVQVIFRSASNILQTITQTVPGAVIQTVTHLVAQAPPAGQVVVVTVTTPVAQAPPVQVVYQTVTQSVHLQPVQVITQPVQVITHSVQVPVQVIHQTVTEGVVAIATPTQVIYHTVTETTDTTLLHQVVRLTLTETSLAFQTRTNTVHVELEPTITSPTTMPDLPLIPSSEVVDLDWILTADPQTTAKNKQRN